MNINVLLSIANHWNFPITDFFIFVNQEECEETYFISPNKYNNNSANDKINNNYKKYIKVCQKK